MEDTLFLTLGQCTSHRIKHGNISVRHFRQDEGRLPLVDLGDMPKPFKLCPLGSENA